MTQIQQNQPVKEERVEAAQEFRSADPGLRDPVGISGGLKRVA